MQLSENPKECQANRGVVTQTCCSRSRHQLLAAPCCVWSIPNLLPSAGWKGWLCLLLCTVSQFWGSEQPSCPATDAGPRPPAEEQSVLSEL